MVGGLIILFKTWNCPRNETFTNLLKDREKLFSEVEIRNLCFQVFQGLACMLLCGYFQHDLKPCSYLIFVYSVLFYFWYIYSKIYSITICFFLSREFVGWYNQNWWFWCCTWIKLTSTMEYGLICFNSWRRYIVEKIWFD